MSQTLLGIDLGSYSVKIAQVERGFGEFQLVGFYEEPLVAGEVLNYHEAACAALAKFLSERSLDFESCVVALPALEAAFRPFQLPFTQARKIDQTLAFELETLIPFEIEDLLYDYTILSTEGESSQVLVSYVPEENFKKFLQQIQLSGIDPRYIGVDALDLSYLPHLGTLPPQGCYGILDLGHTKSNLAIFSGSQFKAVRSLAWGGHHLTQALSKRAGLSYAEAQEFKHQKGKLVAGSRNPKLQCLQEEFESFAKSLKQSLFSFQESGVPPIEALYLSGGTSQLMGVDSFFSRQLNINVIPLNILDEDYTQLSNPEAARATIPTALSLALHGAFVNKGANLNFRRGEYAYKKDIEALGGSLKKAGILAAGVAGLALIHFIFSYSTLSSQVERMNQNVSKLIRASVSDLPKRSIRSSKAALSILDGKISSLEEKLKKIQGDTALSSLEVLKKVSAVMPTRDKLQIDIDDINISPQRVRLEGKTVSYEGVDKIKTAMESIQEFKNVQKGNVRKGVRDEIKFSLSFDIEGGS